MKDKILVVDDDPKICRVLSKVLAPVFDIDVAKTVEQAEAFLSREQYDAVLVDYILDSTNTGFALISRTRSLQPFTSFLIFSGHCHDTLRVPSAQGIFKMLPKTLAAAELIQHIREAVAETKQRRENDVPAVGLDI